MLHRRHFLAGACAAAITLPSRAAAAVRRAVVIGHTGRGDYGHGLDVALLGRPGIEIAAVADSDDAGRARALKRCQAAKGYADYRDMIDKERPQLVVVGPRTTGERREMLLAAVAAGAHVLCEKPFARSPADADEVLALAAKTGVKIAVAHQMRLAPAVTFLKKRVDEGLLGGVAELRAFGKQDTRAGGEDLVVLGVHLFDLMRLFAGDPQSAQATVLAKGRPATLADARPAGEDIGPVLGDQIYARFAFANGVTASFTSDARLRAEVGHWGVEIVGAKGSARVLADIWPRTMTKIPGPWTDAGRTEEWRPLADDPSAKATLAEQANGPANARVVDDWLAAVDENREPACSGKNAAWAVEMAMAVWRAGLTGANVALPLKERGHALI